MSQKQPVNKSLGMLRLIAFLLLVIAIEFAVVGFMSLRAASISPVQANDVWEYRAYTYYPGIQGIEIPLGEQPDELALALAETQVDFNTEVPMVDFLNAAGKLGWEFWKTDRESVDDDPFLIIFRRPA